MPLTSTMTHPTVNGPFEAYLVLDTFRMSARDEVGRATFGIWKSQADHVAGLAPIDILAFDIAKTGQPAVAEVRDEDNNVIVPARAAVLSYAQVKAAFPTLFNGVTAAIEGYVLSHPDFSGAQA